MAVDLIDPKRGALLAAELAGGLALVVALAVLIHRYPGMAPWLALITFSISAELRLRLLPALGVVKDFVVVLLLLAVVVEVLRRRTLLRRFRPIAGPVLAISLVVALYLINPAGTYTSGWIFGTRLLVEALALFVIGLLLPSPRSVVKNLTQAMSVVLPFEALFAWAQHWAGADQLVYRWGYQYGAQVRLTTGGGLRTSGTFEDPFQLAALAVLGLALALFVANKWQAWVLVLSSIAVLGATSVRTAMVQCVVLLVIFGVRKGWGRAIAVLVGVAVLGGVFFLATTTSAVRPGAPQQPLLLTLNGRSTAWAQAIQGWQSLAEGNGVGVLGSGSTRGDELISAPPAYDPHATPVPKFAGSSAFLDSAYAQVQSDVGIVGTLAFVGGMGGLGLILVRRCRRREEHGTAWAAVGVLVVSAVDWIGRASLTSYTTGFITMFALGILIAASSRSRLVSHFSHAEEATNYSPDQFAEESLPRTPIPPQEIHRSKHRLAPPPARPRRAGARGRVPAAVVGTAGHGQRLAQLGLVAAIVSRVFSRLVGVVLVVLLARDAAPDTVAVYGYLLGTATLVVTLTDLGVAAIAGREVAAGRMPAGGALFAALGPHAVSLVVAAIVTVGIVVLAGPGSVPTGALILTVLFVVVGGFVNLWAELLRATGRALLEGGLQTGSSVVLVVGGVFAIHHGGNATDLLLIVLLKEAVVLAVGVWLIRPRRHPEIRGRRLISESLWLAIAGTALILLWRQGMLVIGAAGSIGALSTYVVASRFLDAGVTIGNAAGFGLVPGMSALAGHAAEFRRAARRYLGLAAVAGTAVAIIGVVGAYPLTVIPFGDRWADAVPAVRLIAISSLPILLGFVAWPFLIARGQVRLMALGASAGAVTGLITSIVLVGQAPNALASAIGTAVGAWVLALVLLSGLRDLLGGSERSIKAGSVH